MACDDAFASLVSVAIASRIDRSIGNSVIHDKSKELVGHNKPNIVNPLNMDPLVPKQKLNFRK